MRVDHDLGFSLGVPEGWRVMLDPSPEVAIAAFAPPDASGFSRNVTVTAGPADPEYADMAKWQQTATLGLANALEDFQLIDVMFDPDGDAFRQLISYVNEGRALTLEQWVRTWDRGEKIWGTTISVTTPTLFYAIYADEATEIAWSWRPKHRSS